MKQLQFSIQINASKEKVWETLWQDATFRQWAGLIDPGTHMVGNLEKGGEVQFISGNGYGVTSKVEKLMANESVLLLHSADTQDDGKRERDGEWTGGRESYELSESDGVTTLRVEFDVPEEMERYFLDNYPKAFAQVKAMAEK